MSQESSPTADAPLTSRRRLLQITGAAGTIGLAGCAGNGDDNTNQETGQQNDTGGEPMAEVIGLLNGEPRQDQSEPATILDRPVINQEANPQIYHETANIPDGTQIHIELDHQPYPEAETPEQSTGELSAELTGDTTQLELQNNQPGKYQTTTTIETPNGEQLYNQTQEIYITPTQQREEELERLLESQFEESSGTTHQQELYEVKIGDGDGDIYLETGSDESLDSEELVSEASGISGSYLGICAKAGTSYGLKLQIDASDGKKNVSISPENAEKYLEEGDRRAAFDEITSQF